ARQQVQVAGDDAAFEHRPRVQRPEQRRHPLAEDLGAGKTTPCRSNAPSTVAAGPGNVTDREFSGLWSAARGAVRAWQSAAWSDVPGLPSRRPSRLPPRPPGRAVSELVGLPNCLPAPTPRS